MNAPAGQRWLPVALSVLVHAALLALFGWSWWHFRRPLPAPRQLAIEATVIQASSSAAEPAPQSSAPPAPEPVAAPAPLPAEDPALKAQAALEQAEREREAEVNRVAAQRHEAEVQQQHVREQAKAQAKAAQAKAQARLEAEQKRQADEAARKLRDAEEKQRVAAAQSAAERSRRESDLRAQLASEERINAARGSADAAAYRSMIQSRIERAWIRPAGAQRGVNCEVRVTQVPGGEVTGVQITRCNGDAALRESIEAAVYRASPLPVPTNPDLFDRNLTLNFHPDD